MSNVSHRVVRNASNVTVCAPSNHSRVGCSPYTCCLRRYISMDSRGESSQFRFRNRYVTYLTIRTNGFPIVRTGMSPELSDYRPFGAIHFELNIADLFLRYRYFLSFSSLPASPVTWASNTVLLSFFGVPAFLSRLLKVISFCVRGSSLLAVACCGDPPTVLVVFHIFPPLRRYSPVWHFCRFSVVQ